MRSNLFITLFLACIGLASSLLAVEPNKADWPQWRGPAGQGHSSAVGLPLNWDDSTNVLWKVKTPGRGWSSPIVTENQIWMTTAFETAATPEQAAKRLESNTGDQPLTLLDQVDLAVLCLDRRTGQLLHNIALFTVKEPQWIHKLNSYASPTPCLEAGKLYCQFGAFGTACVDIANAKVDWRNDELTVMHENGPGGSPIVVGQNLVFHLDGSDQQMIVALDKGTGRLAWKTERSGTMNEKPQLRKSYGTPISLEFGGRMQVISPASDWLYGYDPKSGDELWKVPYGQLGFSVTPRPVVGHDMIYCATGFGKGQILAVRYANVTKPEVVWRFNRGTPTMSSPLLVGEELYIVSDNGIFTCLDAISGEERFRERLGGNFSSSPWYADGKIYLSNREGLTYVIRPGKTFERLAENSLPEGILATPAAVDRSIFIRTESQLYRIEQTNATRKP